jgi:hypothetical protein
VAAAIVEAIANEVTHVLLAHVAERHRWAGRMLSFHRTVSIFWTAASRYKRYQLQYKRCQMDGLSVSAFTATLTTFMRNNRHVGHREREAKSAQHQLVCHCSGWCLIVAGMGVVWTTSSTQVVAAPELNQIEPFQIMTKAKDLPDQTFDDRTFAF